MFLSIENLSTSERRRLEMMFGNRLSAYQNVHYQVCVEEVLAALENNLEPEELETFMTSSMSGTIISEMAQDLYVETGENWDEIYEKAVYLIRTML